MKKINSLNELKVDQEYKCAYANNNFDIWYFKLIRIIQNKGYLFYQIEPIPGKNFGLSSDNYSLNQPRMNVIILRGDLTEI